MPDLFVLPLIPNIFPCFEGGTNLFLGNLLIYVKMFGLRQEFSVRFVLFSLPVLLKLATIIIHWHEYFFNLMSSTNGTHFSWLLSITIESISSFLSTYSSLNIFFIHCFRFGIVFFSNDKIRHSTGIDFFMVSHFSYHHQLHEKSYYKLIVTWHQHIYSICIHTTP